MLSVGATDEPLFRCGRTALVAMNETRFDPRFLQQARDHATVGVVANNTGQRDLGLESPQQAGDTGRSTQPDFVRIDLQDEDGGFRADTFGVTPGVSVEDDVAQDEDFRVSNRVPSVEQVVRWHDRVPSGIKCEDFSPQRHRGTEKTNAEKTNTARAAPATHSDERTTRHRKERLRNSFYMSV